ncbi:alanine racemase [Streptomyces sp. NPDC023588]|uniref:alanine racemase n=1 Tax=Streptomyces sp. NPDC023588 TaxID=3154907 RepID=UPI0033D51A2C
MDLNALRHNVQVIREHAGDAQLMAVVKANAYGHGLLRCARTFREAGVGWLATADPQEALLLRSAGERGCLFAWLWTPHSPFAAAVEEDIDISVSALWDLRMVTGAAYACRRRARIHLEVDTGLGRNGCPMPQWEELLVAAVKAQQAGTIDVVGVWSHLAMAEEHGHPSVHQQLAHFQRALTLAEAAGITPQVRHLANSAATLLWPRTRLCGIGLGMSITM